MGNDKGMGMDYDKLSMEDPTSTDLHEADSTVSPYWDVSQIEVVYKSSETSSGKSSSSSSKTASTSTSKAASSSKSKSQKASSSASAYGQPKGYKMKKSK